jgi:GTP:adenosylcobinamide-phosphate guanylyltransferase
VLAGSRGGLVDPIARAEGLTHKAMLTVGGVPMLFRVLDALRACQGVSRIVVCADGAQDLLRSYPPKNDILARPAADQPSRSVAAMLEEFGAPLLVTTADHALLTQQMVAHFLAASPSVAAVARAAVVEAAYPETRRTWLGFRDGRVTGCNLFLLRTGRAASLLATWALLEQQRKRPAAVARLIGPATLLLYLSRALTLRGMLGRLGRKVEATLAAVEMPFADCAIDVDRPGDLALVRRIVSGPVGTPIGRS